MLASAARPALIGLVSACLLAVACGPTIAPGGGSSDASEVREAARPEKVLVVAQLKEYTTFGMFTPLPGAEVTGRVADTKRSAVVKRAALDLLGTQDDQFIYQPLLATELPSVDRGTWRVHPDGTMDTTWKIPTGVKWQDGSPFTSADLLFSFQLFTDREFFPPDQPSILRLMDSANTPDATTIVVHWSATTTEAERAYGLEPLPKHLLEPIYQKDKQSLISSPLLSSEFVGLGAYRIVRWEPGVETVLVRFDDYYRGRPPVDRLIVRYIKDPNALVANILAGSIDVVIPGDVDPARAFEVQSRWEGTGNRVAPQVTDRLVWLRPQFRPELAQPKNGLTLRPVRQAFLQAIDKEALVEAIGHGFVPTADSWVTPGDPLRPQLESAITRYPYDQVQAQRLLEEAGWTRATDGMLVHRSGERFEAKLSAGSAGPDVTIIADAWKAIGAPTSIDTTPPVDREAVASRPFVQIGSNGVGDFKSILNSREITSESNRWTGMNSQGYSNPRVDGILGQLLSAISPRDRVPLQRELLQEVLGTDLAVIPLYWQTDALLVRAEVKAFNWKVFEWDKA